MSTHTLHPLIWLTRRWTSSASAAGSPIGAIDACRSCSAFIVAGIITAGLVILDCMVFVSSVTSSGPASSVL